MAAREERDAVAALLQFKRGINDQPLGAAEAEIGMENGDAQWPVLRRGGHCDPWMSWTQAAAMSSAAPTRASVCAARDWICHEAGSVAIVLHPRDGKVAVPVALGDRKAGARVLPERGVGRLMVRRRIGQRHEQRRHPGGGQLGDRAGAPARDGDVRPRMGIGEVVNKPIDVGRDAEVRVPLPQGLRRVRLLSHMHANPQRAKLVEHRRQLLVKKIRPA